MVAIGDYGRADAEMIIGDEVDPFQGPAEIDEWMPKTEHFVIRREGMLLGHVGLVESVADIGDEEVPVVGFGGVIVARAWRGKGLARALIAAATCRAREMGPDFALLFCRGDRAGIYIKLGWIALPVGTRVSVLQHRGETAMPLRTMWAALHGSRDWPPGRVHLRSLPM